MATIIKSFGSQRRDTTVVQPVAFRLEDLRDQADDYLGKVRDQAAGIIATAHQQAEQIRRRRLLYYPPPYLLAQWTGAGAESTFA